MQADDVKALFTGQDGSYRFARWGRPIVLVVFGVDDATLSVIKGAVEAVVTLAGHKMAETDTETTLPELRERIAKTIAFISALPAEAFEAAEGRTIHVKAGSRELNFPAMQYYQGYALPNFFFHMTTAYAILRSNGVEIGKTDFLGA